MKVITVNHKENDKLQQEELKKEQERIQKETHTITCSTCGAVLHFYRENLKFKFNYNRPEILYGAEITCPCCHHLNEIPKETSEQDYKLHRSHRISAFDRSHDNDKVPEIEVLEEGNFQIDLTCDNCESTFSFDYRDTFEKEVTREICDYMWNKHYITNKETFVKCPICGKDHPVEPVKK